MKINILSSVYPSDNAPKGTTPVVHYFAKEWVVNGHQVHVFHTESAFPKVYYIIGKLFKKALDTLKYYNLLNYENYGNANCVIILYPSLQFALNDDEFESFAKTAIERTKQTIALDGINNYSDINEVNEDGELREE